MTKRLKSAGPQEKIWLQVSETSDEIPAPETPGAKIRTRICPKSVDKIFTSCIS